MRQESIDVSTGATGWGTAISKHPINGEIRQVIVGSNFGTAHVTIAPLDAGYSGTAGIFHGSGTAVIGNGGVGKLKSFPVVAGDHVRVVVSAPGAASIYNKTDKVKIIYQQ